MYSKKTLNRFKNPKFAGEMKDADAVGEVGNVKCGDIMRLYIKVEDNVITDVSFLTYGCVAAIAASDMLCELAKGKTLDKAMKIKDQDITDELKDLPALKHHCSILGTKALHAAIEDYREKHK